MFLFNIGETALAADRGYFLPDGRAREALAWFRRNEDVLMAEAQHVARIAVGFTKHDERFGMSQFLCDNLAYWFPEIEVMESLGYDMILRLDDHEYRISAKIQEQIFQVPWKHHPKRMTGSRDIIMRNAKSDESACQIQTNFDLLFAVQRGPLKTGSKQGQHVVRIGVAVNGAMLQQKCTPNGDSQQKVRLLNSEWDLLSKEQVVTPADPEEVRRCEKLVREYRIRIMMSRFGTIGEDDDQVR